MSLFPTTGKSTSNIENYEELFYLELDQIKNILPKHKKLKNGNLVIYKDKCYFGCPKGAIIPLYNNNKKLNLGVKISSPASKFVRKIVIAVKKGDSLVILDNRDLTSSILVGREIRNFYDETKILDTSTLNTMKALL